MRTSWLPALALAGCTAAAPIGAQQQAIINGKAESGRPNVAQLTTPLGATTAGECTATLIGTHTLLTAAHCVVGATGTPYATFPSIGVNALARSYDLVGGYDNTVQTEAESALDLAIIHLDRDIALEPARVATAAPWVGESVHLVGYGITANNATDYGTLRGGDNTIADVQLGYYRVDDTDATHATVCHGDSGGPDFATAAGVEYLIGVHSRGSCETSWLWGLWDRTVAFSARADSQLEFIQAKVGADLYLGDGRYEKDAPTATISVAADVAAEKSVDVTVQAKDDVRVVSIDLLVDGTNVMGRTYDQATVAVTFPVTVAEGVHTLEAVVRDGAGHETHTMQGFYADAAGNTMAVGDPNGDPAATTTGGDGSPKASGCDVSGRAPSSPAMILFALGLVAMARRRATAAWPR